MNMGEPPVLSYVLRVFSLLFTCFCFFALPLYLINQSLYAWAQASFSTCALALKERKATLTHGTEEMGEDLP